MLPSFFIFDVDGTLTPARSKMTPEMANVLEKIISRDDVIVHLISGSDYAKLQEQVPRNILTNVDAVWACSGNEYWTRGYCFKKHEAEFPDYLFEYLEEKLSQSRYPFRYGKHVEHRTGSVNFSIPGRNSNDVEREMYYEWDKHVAERWHLVVEASTLFPTYDFVIGGQISIDIYPEGYDKSQILKFIPEHVPVTFFGDQGVSHMGNDYLISQDVELSGGTVYNVIDWKHTMSILEGWLAERSKAAPC